MAWMSSRCRRAPWWAFVWAAVLAQSVVAQPTPETAPSVQQLWADGCQQVARGHFDQATRIFDRIQQIDPYAPAIQQVTQWLHEYQQLEQQREVLRQKRYARRVHKAKMHAKRGLAAAALAVLTHAAVDFWQPAHPTSATADQAGQPTDTLGTLLVVLRTGLQGAAASEWGDAIENARQAFYDASDPETFRAEPWLTQIVKLVEAQAAKFQQDGKWLDASALYWRLEQIFEKQREYHRRSLQCQSHARLEATYKLDAEWNDKLQGIDEQMLRDALDRIEQHYVREPDFQKITIEGLRALLTLIETKSLQEVFDSLADEQLVSEFSARVHALLEQVQAASTIDRDDAEAYFRRLLDANRQTIALPEKVVVKEATEGALSALDRFTSLIWPAEVEEFRKHTVGEFSGVGIQIGKDEAGLRVISPLEGTPAYEAGIQPNDLIVKIDGKSAQGISLNRAVMAITGPPGTQVVLTIRREGVKGEFDVPLTRAKIKIHTVKGYKRDEANKWEYMIDPDLHIAYIRITSFMENTVEELKHTLEELRKRDVRGLILDLRVNPGGLLRSAVEMAELFLPKGKLIVKTQGRRPEDTQRTESRATSTLDIPTIILVNGASASASEIVAGAIQDHHRALVLGERTYGKGSVQNLLPIAENTAFLKLTTALYLLPSNRHIDRTEDSDVWGVSPDITIKLAPKELAEVSAMRRRADILRGKGQSEPPTYPGETDEPAEDPESLDVLPGVDPQLEAALLVMRIRVLAEQPWWPEPHARSNAPADQALPVMP